MSEQDLTKSDIKAGLVGALKAALVKHEAALIEAAAAEAAGNRKLAKTGDDRLVPIPIDKNAMQGYGPQAAGVGNQQPGMAKDEHDGAESCPMCGGHAELLGHLGAMAHFRCRNCGAMAALPAHRGNGDQHGESSHSESSESSPELEKVTPPDVSEKVVHKLKDEYGHDKEGKAKAFATAWKIHNQKAAKKSEPIDELAARRKRNANENSDKHGSNKPVDPKSGVNPSLSSRYNPSLGTRILDSAHFYFTGKFRKSEIEVPPTSTVIDKPAKGAKLPGKPAAVDAPGSGGLKKDAAMPHKEAHPDTAAALTELRGIHQGTVPHPETTASLHALRGTHPEVRASLADVRQMAPNAAKTNNTMSHAVTAISPRPQPIGMAAKPAQGAITGAEKRAAGIGFLSNLISRFKGVGNKTWSDMAGRGPANLARAARTAGTRMALSEKDETKKALIVDGAMKAEPTDHKFESKKKPSRLESDVKLCKNCGKPYDMHKTDVEKAEYGEPSMEKAAMAGGIPAAPKPPAAAKPPGAKMTMPKQPAMGKSENKPKKSRIPGRK